ncbi:monooxygenase [Streptomyces diacarni]|uniref:Monooxygenase n=1 Tax=Streptomyces diacarni TaxID=2800381 RepID=A0A367F9C5_9ACTN|nr:FAD-dependent monooxygenase [Streptomyces diacarni]RCG26954.1 monooxygenase [Streptomyces diacarni]
MDPVIIVGAGPVGLALSLALARHAVPSVVLDATDGQPEIRAARTCVLRPDTVAQLPALPGARWRSWRTQRRAQPVAETDLPPERSPLHLAQHALESVLRSALADEQLARVITGSHVDLLEQDPRGVTVHTRGPSGTWWRGSYAVGCDGARSTVRKLLSVRFPGRTAVERHAVAALRVRLPWEEGHYAPDGTWEPGQAGRALLHRDPGGTPGEVTARPLADGLWRLDWLLTPRGDLVTPQEMLERVADTLATWSEEALHPVRPDQTGKAARTGSTARTSSAPGAAETARAGGAYGADRNAGAGRAVGDGGHDGQPALPGSRAGQEAAARIGPYELVDTGVHTAHQRLARHWRVDRAFLAGDAAHLTGALGVQSVDEGLRDVTNLAWKLSLAWHHGHDRTADALLDSYEAERRPTVTARLRAVDQAMSVVRRGSGLRSLLPGGGARSHLALLTDGHLGQGLLGAPPAYSRTPLAPPRGSTPQVPVGTAQGAPVEDVPVTAVDGSRGTLRGRLGGVGGELLVVLVAPGTAVWDSRHWLSAGMMPELAAAVEKLPLRATLLVTEGYPGAAAHTVLVVRADGHLAAALPAGRTEALNAWAEAIRGTGAAAGHETGSQNS